MSVYSSMSCALQRASTVHCTGAAQPLARWPAGASPTHRNVKSQSRRDDNAHAHGDSAQFQLACAVLNALWQMNHSAVTAFTGYGGGNHTWHDSMMIPASVLLVVAWYRAGDRGARAAPFRSQPFPLARFAYFVGARRPTTVRGHLQAMHMYNHCGDGVAHSRAFFM